MIPDPARLARALAAIDAANADDPNRLEVRGSSRPKELAHAELVSAWVDELAPDASEALRLAARAHHVQRWAIPRADFPGGRAGYHAWRRALHAHHARCVADLLTPLGYPPQLVERVQALVTKRDLGRDPEAQVLEDALCLVFLETQYHALAARLDADALPRVVRRTLAKMSPDARERARDLPLDPADRQALLPLL